MNKSKIFLILSLSFIGGIFLRSFFDINVYIVYFLAILAVIVVSVFYPHTNSKDPKKASDKNTGNISDEIGVGVNKNKIILVSGCAILFFVFGIWLVGEKLSETKNINQKVRVFSGEALIAKEPVIKDNYQQIVVEILLKSEAPKSKVLINVGKYPEYFYGDKIKLGCNLEMPQNYEDGFDYRMYLAKDRIFYVCKSAKLELIEHDQGNKLYAGILKLKNNFNKNINQLIPFPESGLMSGLILGGSSGLPKELQNNFSRTGLTHIVAVSGYNVTILAEYLIWFFIFIGLWRKQAFWFAISGIFLFVLMTGLPSSAVRAGVMGSLLLWAMKNGRLANSRNAIVFAAAVMLVLNPLALRWDIGFQLSFLATLGIIYLFPLFEEKLNRNGKMFWLWEILFLSLSAQIFVLPIILYNFHNLSLIALLANILILPIIPLTMLLGFLMAMTNFIFAPLATVLAWLTFLPLKYETTVVNILASFNFSAVEIKNFPWWGVAVWYIIILLSLFAKKVTKKLSSRLIN
ncbi:MAG: ComEC/Rec2 family competence protein [Parcubacteria group bacterium]